MKNRLGRLADGRQNNPSSCVFLPETGEWCLRAFFLAVFGRLAKEDPSACDREKIELEGKTGSRRDGEIGVRSQSVFETPIPHAVRHYPPLLESEIEQAANLAAALEGARHRRASCRSLRYISPVGRVRVPRARG